VLQADAERLGQLAGARAELEVGPGAAAGSHRLEADGRLQGADQDRRRVSLRFGDEVEEAVDPVGEIDVAAPRGAVEDPGPLGQADVGVAGRVVAVVALGLDDRAAAAGKDQPAADQLVGDVVDGAGEELPREALARRAGDGRRQERSSRTLAWTAASVSEAFSSCAASGTEPVPPAIRFDSSQLLRCRIA